MARPSLLPGSYVTLYIGDGADPEIFRPVCGLVTRGLSHQVQTRDNYRRDCDDPSAVPVRGTTATGQQWDLSGQGMMAREVYEQLKNTVGRTVSWRYSFDEPADDVVIGGSWGGRGMLTQLQVTGADGDDVMVDIAVASSGKWEWLETHLSLSGYAQGGMVMVAAMTIVQPSIMGGTIYSQLAMTATMLLIDPVVLAGVAASTTTMSGVISDGIPVVSHITMTIPTSGAEPLGEFFDTMPSANLLSATLSVGSPVQIRYIA